MWDNSFPVFCVQKLHLAYSSIITGVNTQLELLTEHLGYLLLQQQCMYIQHILQIWWVEWVLVLLSTASHRRCIILRTVNIFTPCLTCSYFHFGLNTRILDMCSRTASLGTGNAASPVSFIIGTGRKLQVLHTSNYMAFWAHQFWINESLLSNVRTYLSPYCFISHSSSLSSSTHSSVTCGSVLCGDSARFRLRSPLRMDVTSTTGKKYYVYSLAGFENPLSCCM